MKTITSEPSDPFKDRHILVAVDESEYAKKATLYVGDFLGGVPGFRVTLLNIIPEPSEDYFDTNSDRVKWIKTRQSEALKFLDNYRKILIHSGFSEDKVAVRADVMKCPTLADCILDEQKKLDCCTIVVGRRGISKKEEFIFGSISSKIVRTGKNCAVWVVE